MMFLHNKVLLFKNGIEHSDAKLTLTTVFILEMSPEAVFNWSKESGSAFNTLAQHG